jgi:hypothetical protein
MYYLATGPFVAQAGSFFLGAFAGACVAVAFVVVALGTAMLKWALAGLRTASVLIFLSGGRTTSSSRSPPSSSEDEVCMRAA